MLQRVCGVQGSVFGLAPGQVRSKVGASSTHARREGSQGFAVNNGLLMMIIKLVF